MVGLLESSRLGRKEAVPTRLNLSHIEVAVFVCADCFQQDLLGW
jgi:hypothetical protein